MAQGKTHQIQKLENKFFGLTDLLAQLQKERFGIKTDIKLLEIEFLDEETIDANEMEIMDSETEQLYNE